MATILVNYATRQTEKKTIRLARLSRSVAVFGLLSVLLLVSGQGLDIARSSEIAASAEQSQEVEEADRKPGGTETKAVADAGSEKRDQADEEMPYVRAVEFSSSPQGRRSGYGIGDLVSAVVTFSETVEVTGAPILELRVGEDEKRAIYESGAGTAELVFTWEVVEGDEDADGISVNANSLSLEDGSILGESGNAALLDHDSLADDSQHKVDGIRPVLADGREASVKDDTLILTFAEALDGTSTPLGEDFSVKVEGGVREVFEVVVDGSTVMLSLASTVQAGNPVTVSFAGSTGEGTPQLRDAAGNDASEIRDQAVANQTGNTAPLGGALPLRAVRQIEALLAEKAQRTPSQRKLSSGLLGLRGETQESAATAPRRDFTQGDVSKELVTVDIRADVTPAVLAHIRLLGGVVVNTVPKYRAIRARLPLDALEVLAVLEAVQFIRPAEEPTTRQVVVDAARDQAVVAGIKVNTTEGDVAHRANAARQTHAVDGTGIGVGVLSDGVDLLADQQATGDVPEHVTVLPGQEGGAFDLSCGRRSKGNEGTAMFEIIHDLAPSAELFFASGGGGQAQMAQNIEDLCAAGADVIVDDIGYLLAPAFQDGAIAQAVSTAVANGCYYFSSAGNGGNLNDGTSGVWEGDYTEGSDFVVNGVMVGKAHEFESGVTGNQIVKDSIAPITLQWSDPLGGSGNDYDLFVIDADNNVLASSTDTQDGTQDPIEYIISPCSADREGARVVIVKNAGAADRFLRLNSGGKLAIATSGQTFGHSASQDAVGVAAVDVDDAGGAGGVFNGTEPVEMFSSDGPRRMFFEADGAAITPGNFSSTGGRLLQKPDLAAADGISTSTPGFSTFHGTSAAAPHAAGIAALVLEGSGGPAHVTLDQLRTAMIGSALDIEAMGVDRDSGAGIVMAPGAVDAVDVPVADRNRAPAVVSELADRTFEPGADAVTVDLENVFEDPDNDMLDYTLQLSRDATAVTLSGSVLTLTPAGPMTKVVATVRATDPGGLTTPETFSVTVTAGNEDFDGDDDNLIDVSTLAQLDAMRYDLNGDGFVDGATWQPYYTAFEEAALGMGCPGGCVGYELTADLDFDTDGSGEIDDADDYWNAGEGWNPIGDRTNRFEATFEGNRRTIKGLFINRVGARGDYSGLFGETGSTSLIRRVELVDVNVTGDDNVGGLVGEGTGEIRSSYVTGSVSGDHRVGGLIGLNAGAVNASYATARVTAGEFGGGLAGRNAGNAWIRASYATGRVSGDNSGGLVGSNSGGVAASYATGRVLGSTGVGGLIGKGTGGIRSSYWDRETSGVRVGVGEDDVDDDGWLEAGESPTPGAAGLSTASLQTPTGYEGIYGTWNIDLDGNGHPDLPWFLQSAGSYPILASFDYSAGGYQLSQGPTLTATTSSGQTQVELTWTVLDASRFWLDGPEITYNVIRDNGTTFEVLLEEGDGTQYTDTDVTVGATCTYQVAAVVHGGEATRSAAVSVVAGVGNQPPRPVGMLANRTLRVGGNAVSVDIAGAFVDPEDDQLAYTMSSSTTTVVTVTRSATQVTITPVAAGEATITVTATDTGGSNTSADQRFIATVWSATAVDYDSDDDGLIEIRKLQQLDALRHDLDGDGTIWTGTARPGPVGRPPIVLHSLMPSTGWAAAA